ncbi:MULTISPECIES: ubiquinone anaerobic biosynthesis protein UbiU [Halomonadaceae]|uniref:Ubiquinone biosynthesis protein UbiU n=1 Tax=Vreelandella halophila TaxID=86177 RepID=A0A9X4YCB8_9GAMM|nr:MULTISPECIES: peptidase U32 family protein [Halomonas]MYL27247.1 U32 family peptidase [Halomonas utahensis]MYL74449.1 U32 family peptidase [Halomonas sp. 22501_18_FS]
MELVCPAGSLPALKAAVDAGADAVYIGFRDHTNARQFAGLNFTEKRMREGMEYARQRGTRVFCALNTYPQPAGWKHWTSTLDRAADLGFDALILADMGLLDHAARHHPGIPRHLSVQGSATSHEALRFYHREFGISRAVLPRVLSMDQVRQVAGHSPVELEVFAFGSLCIMAEGRCYLSSYLTDESPNTCGACSPAKAVRWEEKGDDLEARLNGVLIDRFAGDEQAGYPTLCKGRFEVEGAVYHAIEEPTSLNTMDLLPELHRLGVSAVKIEGRQRSPAYSGQVAGTWRAAIDRVKADPETFEPAPEWQRTLGDLSEGGQTTLGAWTRSWK